MSSNKGQTKLNANLKRFEPLILLSVHLFCLAVYLIPVLTHPYPGGPVLDEAHIVATENKDVAGSSSLSEVFLNDYWGRPMSAESSHKSWRPLSILSFRWLKGGGIVNALTAHRIVNIITHAATGEVVSLIAVKVFAMDLSQPHLLLLRCLVKLLFCLHPTHVEVTANAANRPHLFATLVATVLCDTQLHILAVMVFQIVGLMCSETFIFQMPGVVITLTLMEWRNQPVRDVGSLKRSVHKFLPRHFILFVLSVSYLVMRYALDWLSIPEGLIRPAENPFYQFHGMHRVRNYAYILVIHMFKSWNLDFIGFSHEYGFECIRKLSKWSDPRMGMVILAAALLAYVGYRCYQKGLDASLLFLFQLSWMATLFPISGIVKVGTFIADRIVVASTVSVCILAGMGMTLWIVAPAKHNVRPRRASVVLVLLLFMWYRIHRRSLEWMDSYPLLASSLKTCPRSAKSNLEISKIYSGLMPEFFDLNKSLQYLETVEGIDPTYCDVHQQFAHVLIQQQRLLEMEERLYRALICPFTMGGASEMWRRYWQMVTTDPSTKAEGSIRLTKYQQQLEEAVTKAVEEEKAKSGNVASK
jgi:hypothetical protein